MSPSSASSWVMHFRFDLALGSDYNHKNYCMKGINEMKKTLVKIACILGFFAFGSESMSQNPPPNEPLLRRDMNYAQARKVLLDNGWQPFVPAGANLLACGKENHPRAFYPTILSIGEILNPCNNGSINTEIELRRQFRARGWYEAVDCFPKGECFHQFYDIYGRGFLVRTGPQSYTKMPLVVSSRFIDLVTKKN